MNGPADPGTTEVDVTTPDGAGDVAVALDDDDDLVPL